MARWRSTYRMSEGREIKGSWRPIIIHNMNWYLTDLFVYADGLVDCWGLCSLADFEAKVASGWVATRVPDGVRVSNIELGSFEVCRVDLLPGELLVAAVRDEIERLAERPTSSDRCRAAFRAVLENPRDENLRMELREAYFAVPEHLRVFLGDMDTKDSAIRTLMTPVGQRLADRVVTQQDHDQVLAYREKEQELTDRHLASRADRADHAPTGTATRVPQRMFPKAWPTTPGLETLQLDYPCDIEVDGRTYRSVLHAFWATAMAEEADRDAVSAEPNSYRAVTRARESPVRDRWDEIQLGLMAAVLRQKYARYPELTEILRSTGNGPIDYQGLFGDPAYWTEGKTAEARNWVGRLLEVVRSEATLGLLGPPR